MQPRRAFQVFQQDGIGKRTDRRHQEIRAARKAGFSIFSDGGVAGAFHGELGNLLKLIEAINDLHLARHGLFHFAANSIHILRSHKNRQANPLGFLL